MNGDFWTARRSEWKPKIGVSSSALISVCDAVSLYDEFGWMLGGVNFNIAIFSGVKRSR